eukprot:13058190-Alexandrium_andersonii.AAC.1
MFSYVSPAQVPTGLQRLLLFEIARHRLSGMPRGTRFLPAPSHDTFVPCPSPATARFEGPGWA